MPRVKVSERNFGMPQLAKPGAVTPINSTPAPRKYLNTRQASEYTGIPMSTLRKYRYEARGPIYTKPAGRAMYDIADLDAFMQSGRRIPSVRAAGKERQNVAV